MACRFPGGVTTPDDLWRLLLEERDAITPFPADRELGPRRPRRPGRPLGQPGPARRDSSTTVALFDAAFFGISRARPS